LLDQELLVAPQLCVTAHDQGSAVSRWEMHVEHLHSGELVERRPGGEASRQRPEPCAQRDVQAVGQEGDEDMRLEATDPATLQIGELRTFNQSQESLVALLCFEPRLQRCRRIARSYDEFIVRSTCQLRRGGYGEFQSRRLSESPPSSVWDERPQRAVYSRRASHQIQSCSKCGLRRRPFIAQRSLIYPNIVCLLLPWCFRDQIAPHYVSS
jgi:hypothetical protein